MNLCGSVPPSRTGRDKTMNIDNSAANNYRTCPTLYYNSHVLEGTGLELIPKDDGEVKPLELGDRGHQLMEEHYKKVEPFSLYPPSENDALENEAQVIMAGYRKRYPFEDFEVLDVERTIKVALPPICPVCFSQVVHIEKKTGIGLICWCDGEYPTKMSQHIYTGKMDLVVNMPDGKLGIIDHKFEQRTAKSNLPQKWAARDQATLYVWAASKIYNRKPEDINFIVNVCRRPSPKGQVGPEFPDRQKLERTQPQVNKAVRDISIVACQIEQFKRCFKEGEWPDNREECYGWGQCPFYLPCTYGWSKSIRDEKYQPRKEYLKLGGVDIIQ
jgi:hypothetical protein